MKKPELLRRGEDMIKKEMIAMLLAGGQGSRLGVLTAKVAKPAVAFGGKYRIIDFPLSNCINSGIDTVGVLTQYQPLRLNTHIGIGIPWDLDRNIGGVSILPPYEKSTSSEWYTGTANAIYQNLEYMETFNPDYVLILSGDHIYKMDYSEMLSFHKEKNAEVTIAVIEVPWDEANRFGIMNTEEDKKIYEFEEKPQEPKSNLASMGVYIFNWKTLKSYFLRGEKTNECFDDFGHDVIPAMLKDGIPMYAYPFKGYWRDVGTIESLWEANMDLIKNPDAVDLSDSNWRIYTNTMDLPPQYIGKKANVKESLIADGCSVLGTVENTVLSHKVDVGEGSVITNSVIMPNVTIGKNVVIEKAMIAEGAVIKDNAVIKDDLGAISVISEYEVVTPEEEEKVNA